MRRLAQVIIRLVGLEIKTRAGNYDLAGTAIVGLIGILLNALPAVKLSIGKIGPQGAQDLEMTVGPQWQGIVAGLFFTFVTFTASLALVWTLEKLGFLSPE